MPTEGGNTAARTASSAVALVPCSRRSRRVFLVASRAMDRCQSCTTAKSVACRLSACTSVDVTRRVMLSSMAKRRIREHWAIRGERKQKKNRRVELSTIGSTTGGKFYGQGKRVASVTPCITCSSYNGFQAASRPSCAGAAPLAALVRARASPTGSGRRAEAAPGGWMVGVRTWSRGGQQRGAGARALLRPGAQRPARLQRRRRRPRAGLLLFSRAVAAQTQVVSGIKYYLRIAARDGRVRRRRGRQSLGAIPCDGLLAGGGAARY
ncbi:hypothetical protein GUJ93_ZPchr0007g6418 [Zizania palustris]|uniref:Cysteine proteinase inhibitor n=1 Tax=Zizania palustris TaxID=103762 RepID=A0A8J5W5W6_ZIZPA|nr:hypothetical protein GUJ93_ZPchr0007g6418 [Zizania palustris]